MGEHITFANCPDYVESSYFVSAHIHAADDFTRKKVEEIRTNIGLPDKKWSRNGVASFLQGCQALERRDPHFSWLYRNGGPVESQAKVRNALMKCEYFYLKYKGFNDRSEAQASIYKLSDKAMGLAEDCQFVCSKPKNPVTVNEQKRTARSSDVTTSDAFSLVVKEVEQMNDFLMQHPFTIHGTTYLGGLRRTFNRGSLKSGGRFYPSYVTIPKEIYIGDGDFIRPRETATIDGELIAEVDLKAAFLSILAAQSGQWWRDDVADPYQIISFVSEGLPDARDFAKVLVSAIIMRDGKLKQVPTSLRNYKPKKGEKLKQYKKLLDTYKGKDLIAQVHQAFPFLSEQFSGQEVVYWESEVVAKTILSAMQVGIPAYPLHDALFVREKDACEVENLLTQNFRDLLGCKPYTSFK